MAKASKPKSKTAVKKAASKKSPTKKPKLASATEPPIGDRPKDPPVNG